MDVIDYIKKVNNAYNSGSQKESDIYSIKNQMGDFKESLDYEPESLINGVKQGLLVRKTKDAQIRNITANPDETFKYGDVVDCYKKKWLVTKVDPNEQVYCSGKMQRCNYELKFIASNGKPVSRQCIVYNSSGSLEQNNYLTLETGKLFIRLPLDSETLLLKEERRLFVDYDTQTPTAYKIVDNNSVSENYGEDGGNIILTVKTCERNSEDNTDLMIANYNEDFVPTPPSPVADYCEINYSGEPELMAGLGFKKFTASFKDVGGNALIATPVWTVVVDGALTQYVKQDIADDYIRLKVTDVKAVGSTIILQLKDSGKTMSTEIELEVLPIG